MLDNAANGAQPGAVRLAPLSDDAFERLYPDEEACRKVTNIIDALLTTACIFVIANRLTD